MLYHPLRWPLSRPRSKTLEKARFAQTRKLGAALSELGLELLRLEAIDWQITTNLYFGAFAKLTERLFPEAVRKAVAKVQPTDPGVAVYFTVKGKDYCLCCDKYNRVEDNVWAIALHISAVRALERYGVGTRFENLGGYQLKAGSTAAQMSWPGILGVELPTTKEVVMQRYRDLVKFKHPDAGGSHEEFVLLQRAMEEAIKYLDGY